jgi:2-methylcitrate dehydratase PrpD
MNTITDLPASTQSRADAAAPQAEGSLMRTQAEGDDTRPQAEGNDTRPQAGDPGLELATFCAGLQFERIPADVVARAEDLFFDWVGSTLAGRLARPVQAIERFTAAMGPADGGSEILGTRRMTSPLFAAMANAAASHVAEQDDVHNGSVFHPAAVIFPAVLAMAQANGNSGREMLVAAVAGYEAGIRIGEFMGRSHYRIFHTTGTVGTVAAAIATARLLRLSPEQTVDAIGSAGTQAAGLWEFLRDAADSKQLHTAKAASDGLMSAVLAGDGFRGARRILDGAQGLAAGMSKDADPARLTDRLGSRWALAETSFKFHASCRHTHPAADALLQVVQRHALQPRQIASVVTHVHQGAIDVLGAVKVPATVHQGKFSMGTVLGLIGVFQQAGLTQFEEHFLDAEVSGLRDKVTMELDEEVDGAYPARWIGKVTVTTTDGRVLHGRVDEPKGDPGNTLSRPELEQKLRQLAVYGQAGDDEEIDRLIGRLWQVASWEKVPRLLAPLD